MWPTTISLTWPWIAAWTAYAAVSLTVLFFMRRASAQIAGIGDDSRSFPETRSLRSAAATFARQACPQLLIAAITICFIVRVWLGGWSYWDAVVLIGAVATWPVQEWLVHKLLLHLRPIDIGGRKVDLVIAIHHREHHKNPWDPILGITPAYIILAYVLLFIPVWLLLMPPALALTLAIVFFGLALNYEWLHYLIHTSYVPKTALYKRLWKNHRLHHFKNENYWYGVTMLEGDVLLGTQPAADATPRSDTCLDIAPDADAARYTGA
jgi:hypothetical protein